MSKRLLLVFLPYLLILAMQLVSRLIGLHWLHVVSKPLLMPLLIIPLWLHYKPRYKAFYLLNLALIFSWAGDIALMQDSTLMFITGLSCFLMAHVAYILFFTNMIAREGKGTRLQVFVAALPWVAIATSLVLFLWTSLGHLGIPVAIYATAIACMATTATLWYWRSDQLPVRWCLAGALLFVISDAVLAINKFAGPADPSGFWVMVTYGLAQFAIISGALRHQLVAFPQPGQ